MCSIYEQESERNWHKYQRSKTSATGRESSLPRLQDQTDQSVHPWINYKETYDSMPHILECFELCNNNRPLSTFIKNLPAVLHRPDPQPDHCIKWLQITVSEWSNHQSSLFYIDYIKLYTRSEQDTNSLIHTTRIYSNIIRMAFRLDMCGQMVSKSVKMIRTEGVDTRKQHSRCRQLQIPWVLACKRKPLSNTYIE